MTHIGARLVATGLVVCFAAASIGLGAAVNGNFKTERVAWTITVGGLVMSCVGLLIEVWS